MRASYRMQLRQFHRRHSRLPPHRHEPAPVTACKRRNSLPFSSLHPSLPSPSPIPSLFLLPLVSLSFSSPFRPSTYPSPSPNFQAHSPAPPDHGPVFYLPMQARHSSIDRWETRETRGTCIIPPRQVSPEVSQDELASWAGKGLPRARTAALAERAG